METKPKKLVSDIVALRRLRAILWFELSTAVLIIFNFFWALTLAIVIVAALLFTPYMLYVLFKEKHYGWISFFFFIFVLPYIILLLLFYNYILLTAWLLAPIPLLYCYYFVLKYSVDDWLKEYDAHEQLEEQRRESEQRKKDEMMWS
jgi:hypothetical protein